MPIDKWVKLGLDYCLGLGCKIITFVVKAFLYRYCVLASSKEKSNTSRLMVRKRIGYQEKALKAHDLKLSFHFY